MSARLKTLVTTAISVLILVQCRGVFCENVVNQNPINWNFRETDIVTVIEAVAEYTGKNFLVDDSLKGGVTLITATEIPPDLAYQILESILATRDFALVPAIDGNVVKVVPAMDAPKAAIPTTVAEGLESIETYENFVTQIEPIEYAQASELASVLQPLKSDKGLLSAYNPANLLLITDRASAVQRLVGLVREIDVAGIEEKWEIFQLDYQSADILAEEILEVLSEEASALAAGQRVSREASARSRLTTRTTKLQEPSIVGAARTPLRIVPDMQANSLIVVAVDTMMDQVKKLIEKLDVPSPFEEGNVHVYQVKNGDAEEIAGALDSLITTTGTTSRSSQQAALSAAVSGTVAAFEREVRIEAYVPTNALLVTASPRDWATLKMLLEKIDIRERQVWVEAVIMEVTISDDTTVGVDLAAIEESDIVAASTFGNLANLIIQGPLGFTGGLVGALDGETEYFNPLTGETMTVPNVPILLTAIQTVTNVNILSAPNLLTTDNKESKIHVGKEIPVVTGSQTSLSTSVSVSEGITPSLYSQYERQPVGILLQVTPQISYGEGEDRDEGANVKLEVYIEVSDTIESEVGIDPNLAGPTLRTTEIENTVVIPHGQMAIMGGLMSQKEDTSRSQVPILGDIPILGFFFRQRARVQEKRNLVVILTPRIVKSGKDLEELTARYRDEYDKAKLELRGDQARKWGRAFKKITVGKD